MKRLIMSASQFKLSAPGKDVTTATGDDIVFDAFGASAYNGVYMAGFVTADQFTIVNNNYSEFHVGFGKTFPAIPQALVRLKDVNEGSGGLMSNMIGSFQGNGCYVKIYISTTELIVGINHSGRGDWFPGTVGFAYLILQF